MMNKKEVGSYRHEYKYLLHKKDSILLKNRLKHVMAYDSYSDKEGYDVNSLYFEDVYGSAFTEKEEGIYERNKYRLRYYDDNPTMVKMEIKKNKGSYIQKAVTMITKEETLKIIKGTKGLVQDEPIKDRFRYQMNNRGLHPKIIISYRRIPFVYQPLNVRVTIDEDIRYSTEIEKFYDRHKTWVPLIDKQMVVLEVKYNQWLPTYISRLLATGSYKQVSFSKYAMSVEHMKNTNENMYRGGL